MLKVSTQILRHQSMLRAAVYWKWKDASERSVVGRPNREDKNGGDDIVKNGLHIHMQYMMDVQFYLPATRSCEGNNLERIDVMRNVNIQFENRI